MVAMPSTDNSHMDAATQALCFFYRNPPPGSGVPPQPFKKIPKLVGKPHMGIGRVKMAVWPGRSWCFVMNMQLVTHKFSMPVYNSF